MNWRCVMLPEVHQQIGSKQEKMTLGKLQCSVQNSDGMAL